jgi:hypothetical protein
VGAASPDTPTPGLTEVVRSVREIERITGVTVGEADQIGATAHALAEQAAELEARARRFRLDGAASATDDDPADALLTPRVVDTEDREAVGELVEA